jgi:N-acyl homoserine lactone hydrolase
VSYEIVELVQGFPGRSTRHGGLGWSSVTVLRGDGRLMLVDTGSFGMRPMLADRLAGFGIDPAEVTDILLTHAHYDHAANYLLFPRAEIHISAAEVEWASSVGPAFMPLPELYAQDLAANSRTRLVFPGEVLPGITAVAAPGHTPGSTVFRVDGRDGPVLFTGDAAKNRAELLSGDVDMTLSHVDSKRTVYRILSLWREVPGTLLVPGHDVPLRWPEGAESPEYVGARDAGISAWFGDDLSTTVDFDLTEGR